MSTNPLSNPANACSYVWIRYTRHKTLQNHPDPSKQNNTTQGSFYEQKLAAIAAWSLRTFAKQNNTTQGSFYEQKLAAIAAWSLRTFGYQFGCE
ncbi:hypothetical protein QE152_g18038 [Popillia japonica]|uniref:Uncharacterized protein n=1 Tax=Popillia japonica TaxID=7064 RepID=A0AAW1L4M0_POPJA